MFYNKISIIFAIILLIPLLDFTYSFTFFSPYNNTDIFCADNRIGLKMKEGVVIEFYGYKKFPFTGSRNFTYGLFIYDYDYTHHYYRASMGERRAELDAEDFFDLERYSQFLLLPEVPSLESFFNFRGKEDIEEIDFDLFDYSKVTSFENTFKGLSGLKSIRFKSKWKRCDSETYPQNNRPKPIVMTGMLQGCSSLVSVDLSEFDTSLVEDMSSLLEGCLGLRALNISNFNFIDDNVTQNMFLGVEKLQYINLNYIKGYTDQIISTDIFDNSTEPIVCQDREMIQSDYDVCCDIEIGDELIKCKNSSNFIILYYSQNCVYEDGFIGKSNYRNRKYLISYNGEILKKIHI